MRKFILIGMPIMLTGCAMNCDTKTYTETPCPSAAEIAGAQEWKKLEDQFVYTSPTGHWVVDQRANPLRQPVSQFVNWIVYKCEHKIACNYDYGVTATMSTR